MCHCDYDCDCDCDYVCDCDCDCDYKYVCVCVTCSYVPSSWVGDECLVTKFRLFGLKIWYVELVMFVWSMVVRMKWFGGVPGCPCARVM